jgi:CRISPR associated protein Cas1
VKPLYLEGRGGLEVVLDGPSLRVRRPGRADGHYPLPRVARVIAVGAVHWQPEALNACLCEHKPVAVLDSQGRFVRVLFRPSGSQYGLARHLGQLLAVPRFRARYARWRYAAERAEMRAAAQHLDIRCQDLQPENLWQIICLEQYRRRGIRPGGCYRYLLGLAAAQIASGLALNGMPRDPQAWDRQEYRLFGDLLRLERWRQAVQLDQILAGRAGHPRRRELTAAFERLSGEREARITAWRQSALLAMMGVRPSQEELTRCQQTDWKQRPLEMSAILVGICRAARPAGNCGRIPLGARGSLRTSARIVRAYLEYDRRVYESYRTT